MATSFTVNKADLEFMLKQIKIAEATSIGYTAAPKSILQAIMDSQGASAAVAQQLPFGLRTVDGSYNSLLPTQSGLGAADGTFPRLTDPVYRNESDGDGIAFGGPGGPTVQGNYGQPGLVVDADPRIISNLIVDMSVNNPAAIAAYLGNPLSLEQFEHDHPGLIPVAPGDPRLTGPAAADYLAITNADLHTIPNLSPDIGLSPGFNAWMTFFGQFFDHGLDLVTKGGNDTVYIPLQPDDPLIAGADGILGGAGAADDLPAHLRFMALTRATPTIVNGVAQHQNTTTAFVDQNQTYTSHSSHQVFLREYARIDSNGDGILDKTVATGRLIDGTAAAGSVAGAIGNWAEVKEQALTMLGIRLNDFDVHNVPLLLTDQYGKFIPGPNGYAQMVMAPDADHPTANWLKEGTAAGITTAGSIGSNHAFLNDLQHHAAPGFNDLNFNGVRDGAEVLQTADLDPGIGDDGDANTYDDEALNLHFITGDGRGNENTALTTVHSIFHSEHNRLVEVNKATILASNDLAFINEWLATDLTTLPTAGQVLNWDGERLFQAARFATEMQYQHLVFEEFARRIQPMVDPFIFNSSPNVDPSIVAEFAHTVYRFGHSMLTGTVDRLDNNLNLLNGDLDQKTLLASFLNPTGYMQSGATIEEINANFIRGLSRDVGNAMDEFIVTDVRSNLLGLPLDLAALNIARGRDTGIPSLNETRAQLYNDTGLADLTPYASWSDFALNIKNPTSVINFIAAYGTHASLTAAGLTAAQMREAATLLVLGDGNNADGVTIRGVTYTNADRLDFLNGRGIYAATANSANPNDLGGLGGLNDIDLWIGGLAEKSPEFGGMLGTTFNFVFEYQMESLQNGDRLYYLTRTQGTNFLNQLEPNTFSDLVMRNTDLGGIYSTHVNGALFTTPDHIIELDRGIAQTDYNGVSAGRDPEWDGSNPVVEAILGPKVVRDYTGATTVQAPATNLPLPNISNGSFEQNSLATGQPGVITDALGNYTMTAPTGWSIAGGEGGLFAPAATVTAPAGHTGSNVVWLRSGATLSKDTGVTLVQGAIYSVSFKVGDRTDSAWPGGTARLMASDGNSPAVELATLSLTAPANGQWSNLSLATGAIANTYNGYRLYFEVQQGDGTLSQILVDDVSIAANYTGATVTHDVGGYLRVQGGEHYVLGGTEGNDFIYGDSGIDTLWGDGGDDYLNGMTESDDVFGGAGDDIIEDPFGDDVLRGNQGNDVITSARGADLMFGDQGQDYILVGQDAGEVFAGTDNDFVLGGNGKDFLLGNEGDDWIEGGGGFDTIAGDNSELFFNSPVIGHDVLFGQGDETDYDAESGDDIMGSGPSVFRYEGMFGFDWGIAKNDIAGVNFDLQIPIFTTIPNDVLRDRFDQVEALSGWKFQDHLDGDDRGHSGGSSSPDSTPVELFVDHTLDAAGIARIAGLDRLLGGIRADGSTASVVTSFKNGNVLVGGDGNDFLRGRGGFDTIDGDAWLNVRIKIVIPTGPDAGTYSAESMSTDTAFAGQYAGKVYNVYTAADTAADPTHIAGAPNFASPAFEGRSLNSLMLDRTINPGQLSIVREILYDNTNTGASDPLKNIDTAIFQGGDLEYEIEGTRIIYDAVTGEALRRVNSTGPESAPLNIRDVDNDGFITVRDLDDGTVAAPGRVGGLTVSRGALTDDTDKLVNIERLQFADKTLTVGASNNTLATGTVTISDPTPFDHDGNPATPGVVSPIVGQVLTATLSNLVDPDGVPIDPATGMPVGLTFEWQTTEAGNDGGWATITTGLTYTVRPVDPSHVLRAVAVFQDSKGVTERIASGQTDNVTAPFSVNENTASGTVIAPIPFSLDYDPLGFGGTGVTDGDVVQLTHVISPGQDAGGRFTVVNTGTALAPVYQLAVANGGLLNYEAPVHTPANQSHQFVDNQYQIVIDTYTDTIANGGVLMAQRQFTIFINDVTGEVADIAPTLDLNGNGILSTTTTAAQAYRDNFDTAAFNNSNGAGPGAQNWAPTPWAESNDSGGVTAGQIQIDAGNSNQLRFIGGATSDGASIARTVNLTGVTTATLSFDYDRLNNGDNISAGETVQVQFSATGSFTAGNFVVLQTINNSSGDATTGAGSFSLNLPLVGAGATSAIRFVSTAISETTEEVRIDNLNIATTTTTTTNVTGAAGTGHTASYTEGNAAVAIASFPAVADADNATLTGATVKLTNAQAGDALTVQGALPAGIIASYGPAIAGVITMYLGGNGPISKTALQTAIGQVRFSNASNNPNPTPTATPRSIEVTVSDGEKESVIATATVNVTPQNDPMVANDDRVVTNIASGTAFAVAEWAFLANDVGDAPDITAISGVNGLTASLTTNPGSITITNNPGGTNVFNYTATDGAETDLAAVSYVGVTTGPISGNDSTTVADILVGDGGNTTFDGGTGNDVIFAGAGDDIILWNAGGGGAGDGRDIVNGGTEGASGDEFRITGNASVETYTVYTRAAALAAMPTLLLRAETEIVVRRQSTGGSDSIVAELSEIEEIRINGADPAASTGANGDTFNIVGDFSGTSLKLSTITIDGVSGDDTVDISALTSAHRIVFRSNGGNDTIVGTLRPQDVIELPNGAVPEDYTSITDESGVTTMTNGTHSICFTAGEGMPQFGYGNDTGDGDDDDDDDVTGSGDDDDDDCGCDEDDDGPGTPAPNPNPSTGGTLGSGTAAADVLIGTANADNIIGLAGDDTLIGDAGADAISAGEGADFIDAGDGRDVVFAGAGDDQVFGGGGVDMLYGEAGNDRILGGAGNDLIDAGTGNDTVVAGGGDDLIVAAAGDGDDTYFGDEIGGGNGIDTLDFSAITASLTVDLGNGLGGRGSAASSQSGSDTLWSIENIATGSGSDVITASDAVNVMEGGTGNDTFRFLSTVGADGDTILDFQPGDRLDLSAIDADASQAGNQSFTLANGGSFTTAGQLTVTYETRADGEYTIVKGNVDAATDAEFQINLKGSHNLTANSFIV